MSPMSLHRYGYAVANPLAYVDPSGRIALLRAVSEWIGIAGEDSIAFADQIDRASADLPFYARPFANVARTTAQAGYMASGVGEFVVDGANWIANFSMSGADRLGRVVGAEETVFSGLADEANAEFDQVFQDTKPVVSAVQQDALGVTWNAGTGMVGAYVDQFGKAFSGDARAQADLASNFNPRQWLRNAERAVFRAAERKAGAPIAAIVGEGNGQSLPPAQAALESGKEPQLSALGNNGASAAIGDSRVGTGTTAGGMKRASSTWRQRYGPASTRDHHLVPQAMLNEPAFVSRLAQLGVTDPQAFIDRKIARITHRNHADLHDTGWNADWASWMSNNPEFTLRDVEAQIRSMMRDYNVPASSRQFTKTYGSN